MDWAHGIVGVVRILQWFIIWRKKCYGPTSTVRDLNAAAKAAIDLTISGWWKFLVMRLKSLLSYLGCTRSVGSRLSTSDDLSVPTYVHCCCNGKWSKNKILCHWRLTLTTSQGHYYRIRARDASRFCLLCHELGAFHWLMRVDCVGYLRFQQPQVFNPDGEFIGWVSPSTAWIEYRVLQRT